MHKGEIDGKVYREYEYDYYTANTSSVKRYKNALMLLMGVTGCELHLIEWLSENMTEGNYVQNLAYSLAINELKDRESYLSISL